MIDSCLRSVTVGDNTIVIILTTPVDKITPYVQQKLKLPSSQVVGFGGDLDLNRAIWYAEKNIQSMPVHVIGEHGANVIPIYKNNKEFPENTNLVRMFLHNVSQKGQPYNFATSVLLNKMIDSMFKIKTLRIIYVFFILVIIIF